MIAFNGMSEGYPVLIGIARAGEPSSPRGTATREHIGFGFKLINPYDNLPTGNGRNLGKRIAIAEAMQLLAGRSYPELMVRIAPNFANFTDGGLWFHGAYGPRLRYQLPKVLAAIHQDNDTRQAIATIWDPAYDGVGDVRDTPCTIALQFLLRDGRMHMVTTMRSNDVWWGVPYDVFQFTTLLIHVAHAAGSTVGTYTHQAGSFHMYDRDAEAAAKVVAVPAPPIQSAQLITYSPNWETVQRVADAILSCEDDDAMAPYGRQLRDELHA